MQSKESNERKYYWYFHAHKENVYLIVENGHYNEHEEKHVETLLVGGGKVFLFCKNMDRKALEEDPDYHYMSRDSMFKAMDSAYESIKEEYHNDLPF